MESAEKTKRQFRSLRELATITGKHYRTLHRAAKSGKIRANRFGSSLMVPEAEVTRILERGWR
jgi:excisionase family DNA binding protein